MEILNVLMNSGKIKANDDVAKIMKNIEVLEIHPYAISYLESEDYWYTRVQDNTKKNKRRRVKRKNKADLIEYLVNYYKEDLNKEVTFGELYLEWFEHRKLKVAERTRNRNIDDYNKFYADNGISKMKIVDITHLYVEEFLCRAVSENKLNKKSYQNMVIVLRGVLGYAVKRGIITENPTKEKDDPRKNYSVPKNILRKESKAKSQDEVFTLQEQKDIIRCIDNRLNEHNLAYLAVKFTFELGLRVGELSALKWTDISGRHITIQRQEVSNVENNANGTKGSLVVGVKEQPKSEAGFRSLYLTKTALKVLTEVKEIAFKYGWYNKDGYIFVGENGRLTVRQLLRPMGTICTKLNIKPRNIHKIRKTVISSWIDDGINLEECRQMSGHESIKTLLDSYCFNREDRSEVEERLERISAR